MMPGRGAWSAFTSLTTVLATLACGSGQGYDEDSDPASRGSDPADDGATASTLNAEITVDQLQRAEVLEDRADAIDETGGALRVIEVPAASNEPSIASTPLGWLALSRRILGDARALLGAQSVLYRSQDGVQWQRLPLAADDLAADDEDLLLSGLAYGNGNYVMVGSRLGKDGVVWHSDDAETWSEISQGLDPQHTWRDVVFAGNLFFALGFSVLGVSENGLDWTAVSIDNVQPQGVAFGNGRYVLVGSGPMEVSEDGLSWTPHDVDCALPGACISDPSGGIGQSIQYRVVFAKGRFHTDQLSSEDGVNWLAEPELYPSAYVSEQFFGPLRQTPLTIATWHDRQDVRLLKAIRPTRFAQTRYHNRSSAPRSAPRTKTAQPGKQPGFAPGRCPCVAPTAAASHGRVNEPRPSTW